MIYKLIYAIIISLFTIGLYAQIETYSYPDAIVNGNNSIVKRSTVYEVTVNQEGLSKACYVMYDKNQAASVNAQLASNPDNHWTNFSIENGTVEIVIKRIDGNSLNSAKVYPTKKGYTASINGNTATINIPAGVNKLQLLVEMNGLEKQPLFVFVDPKETDVPSIISSDVTVINTIDDITTVRSKLNSSTTYKYFEPGIHKWGTKTGADYDGYKLPVLSGKKIYLPGGAYVIGSFAGDNNSNWKVYGRGIISGAGLDILGDAAYIPWSAVHHQGTGSNFLVEGIVSMCPPHFGLTIRGTYCIIDNVKMMSWWYSTDGTITGNNSKVNNCFFKVNDDNIKVYGSNCTHDNNTMYHQINGAPFQFSWTGQASKNTSSTNTYIVNSVYKSSLTSTSNTAVINCVEANQGQIIENHIFDGIYIDNGCHRLLGLDATNATLRNITIKNIKLNSGTKTNPQNGYSYLDTGNFSGIQLCNVYVNNNLITGFDNTSDKPSQGKLFYKGQLPPISFCSNNGDNSLGLFPNGDNESKSSLFISKDYFNNTFDIRMKDNTEDEIIAINLFLINGQKVNVPTIINDKSSIINLSSAATGVYVVQIKTLKGIFTKKVIN